MRRTVREPVRGVRRLLVVVALSFSLGALADAGLAWRLLHGTGGSPLARPPAWAPAAATIPAPAHATTDVPVQRPGDDGRAAPVGTTGPAVTERAVETLRHEGLALPVQGVTRSDLHDTFTDTRESSRRHEAIDIMAPRHTAVLAADAGRVEKLFTSKAGGLTIYQFDPSGTFCYYYAHLDGYADGLREGQTVQRGQIIGYVGSTGNASAGAPHLHFAIFRLTPARLWWQGEPINPYPVLR
jgi:murein DD-endopeptidase MepM/ murein hydrolase activator NlpD